MILDAITTDPLVAVLAALGPLGLALYGAIRIGPEVVRTVRHALRARQQRAITEAEAERTEAEQRAREAGKLWERLDRVERRTEECEQHRDECRDQLHATQTSLTSARYDIGRLSQRVGELLAERGESTGVHEVEEIRARNATPIPARPETIVPPPSGEEE